MERSFTFPILLEGYYGAWHVADGSQQTGVQRRCVYHVILLLVLRSSNFDNHHAMIRG